MAKLNLGSFAAQDYVIMLRKCAGVTDVLRVPPCDAPEEICAAVLHPRIFTKWMDVFTQEATDGVPTPKYEVLQAPRYWVFRRSPCTALCKLVYDSN